MGMAGKGKRRPDYAKVIARISELGKLERPGSVEILAALSALLGILEIALIVLGVSWGISGFDGIWGIGRIVAGLVLIMTAWGLWRGIRIFWYVAVFYIVWSTGLSAYNIIMVFSFFRLTGFSIVLILNLWVMWMLWREDVKKWFGITYRYATS
jgi:hypothetical protein